MGHSLSHSSWETNVEMNKQQIQRLCTHRYQEQHADSIVNMSAYRESKKRQEALKKQGRILDSMRYVSLLMASQLGFNANWAEMDRLFNDLYEMGCIPEVRMDYAK